MNDPLKHLTIIPPDEIGLVDLDESVEKAVQQPVVTHKSFESLGLDKTKLLELERVEIKVGKYTYYNSHELALSLRVPEYHLRRACRQDLLHGRKVGKAFFITADSLFKFISTGGLQYTRRDRVRTRTNDDDMQVSKIALHEQQKIFDNWLLRHHMHPTSEEVIISDTDAEIEDTAEQFYEE